MKTKIAIIGIGYIGLPLSLNLAKFFNTVAYDIDKKLILRLKKSRYKR